jgi:MFS transporter, FSR family, fosmidomycin resistance protein
VLLSCVALMDELWSGVAVVAAPDVEREQGVGHGAYALLVFALPLLGAAVLEAGLALLSDRWARRRVAGLGLLVTAGALAACAFVPGRAALVVGLAVAGGASGIACAAGQAELVSGAPGAGERAMARWVLFGAVGDMLTPLLAALVLGLGGGYRAVFGLVALSALALAVLLGSSATNGCRSLERASSAKGGRPREAPSSGEAPSPGAAPAATPSGQELVEASLIEGLRAGVRNRALWLWLLGAAMCTFLDEIVVALGALHAERDLGASAAASAACVTGTSIGMAVGAALTERSLLRFDAARVSIASAAASLIALAAVVAAPSVSWLALALGLLGAAAAPQYALLQARAYAALPGRPGVVNALAQVFVVVDIVGPLALGALADSLGVGVALACLCVQPLAVLIVMLISRARSSPPRADAHPPAPSTAGPSSPSSCVRCAALEGSRAGDKTPT